MSAIEKFAERARKVSRTIVLPEGQDPRVILAAEKALAEKVVGKIIVLGSDAEIDAASKEAGVQKTTFERLDYMKSPLFEEFAQQL